jgi:hypothetical protein
MSRKGSKVPLIIAATALLAACSEKPPTFITLKGDTLIGIAQMTFANGIKSAECAFSVKAIASGPEGSRATLTSGRVVYLTVPGGDTMIKRPIEAANLPDLFSKTTLHVGDTIESTRQGMSLSQPVHPIHGVVTFNYTTGDSKESKVTDPYAFTCH